MEYMRRSSGSISFASKPPKKKFSWKLFRSIIIWIIEIILMIFLAHLVLKYIAEELTISGVSMEMTEYMKDTEYGKDSKSSLEDGDRIIINKVLYRFSQPNRFDVVVFETGGVEHDYYNVKRIIGLPGETVSISNGKLFINGEELENDVTKEEIKNGGLAQESVTLDDDEYFVLGDNRNKSEDSRFSNIGNVSKDKIIGKAWLKLKPFHKIKGGDYETSKSIGTKKTTE
ncbi:MAG: signal peptidase I [Lachnospiraceae bacterium]|nr:signal peptidase I [Lachnospiraceae bacterium]